MTARNTGACCWGRSILIKTNAVCASEVTKMSVPCTAADLNPYRPLGGIQLWGENHPAVSVTSFRVSAHQSSLLRRVADEQQSRHQDACGKLAAGETKSHSTQCHTHRQPRSVFKCEWMPGHAYLWYRKPQLSYLNFTDKWNGDSIGKHQIIWYHIRNDSIW